MMNRHARRACIALGVAAPALIIPQAPKLVGLERPPLVRADAGDIAKLGDPAKAMLPGLGAVMMMAGGGVAAGPVPTVQAVATSLSSSTSSTNISLEKLTSYIAVANDIHLLFVGGKGNTDAATASGFSTLQFVKGSNESSTATVLWRRLVGGEDVGGSQPVDPQGSGNNYGFQAIIRGCVQTGNPYEGIATFTEASNSVHTLSAITTLGGNRLLSHFLFVADDNVLTLPGGWDSRLNDNSAAGTDGAIGWVTKSRTAAGTEASVTASGSASDPYCSISFALMPQPA